MKTPVDFPLGAGGPFHRLQMALKLLDEDHPKTGRRVLVGVLISWLPLALLWWWQGLPSETGVRAASVFTHLSTYARFFVTLPLLIVAENAVRPHIENALSHALTSRMVPPSCYERFAQIMLRAMDARESRIAEMIVLGLAFGVAHTVIFLATQTHHASWIHTGPTLTWAGTWYAWVSLPLLQFLIFRWLYRLALWWRVMYGLSRLDLNIQPGHPDQRGGLAFLGDSVQGFAILAVAFAGAAAGSVADFVVSEGASILELKGFIGGAVAFVLILFLIPLTFFAGAAYRAKDEALLRYEGLAERHWQAFSAKCPDESGPPSIPEQINVADFSAMADLGTIVKGVREMNPVPLTKEGVLPLLVAILLPFLPVLAVAFPIDELLSGIVHVFFGKAE